MNVYSYDPATGEFLVVGMAQTDPLNQGSYLIPAHSTVSPPPDADSGRVVCWDGAQWIQVEDHRGEQGWLDGEPCIIIDLGPLPEGWSGTPPEPTPDELLEAALADIEVRYAAKVAALRERIEIVLLGNGAAESANRAALAAEWQTMQDARDAEILELMGGV